MPCSRVTGCFGDVLNSVRSFLNFCSHTLCTMSPQLTLQTPLELVPSEVPTYLEQLWSPEQWQHRHRGINLLSTDLATGLG
jgi:hypothetical protein